MRAILLMLIALPAIAFAGGSNYTISPGVSQASGKISEWPGPTPKFARDPAAAPDGRIYITVMQGNRLARFDPATQKFDEWELPAGIGSPSLRHAGRCSWLAGMPHLSNT